MLLKQETENEEQETWKWIKGAKHRVGNKVNGNASVKVSFCSHFPFFRRAR